jgi:eukaryotic-like serine/threonine-protein kinase
MTSPPTQDRPTDLEPGVTRPDRAEAVMEKGTRVGRYEVLEVLGMGGGGAVYEAFDETLKRKIALKVLHVRAGDPLQATLLREARALAQFSHPNVVAVYDVGEAAGKSFIAMELAPGERLDTWLRQPKLTWHQTLKVFLEAGKGLAAVHEAKLVHRDFKPGNVVVRTDGRVQLIDFGIAREDQAGEPEAAHPALVSGTPGFMAPEHMRGELPNALSDQFSFCCAVYDALLGVMPFGERADLAQLTRIEKRQFAEPAKDARVPRKVIELLQRGLAFEPTQRFGTMDELVRALSRTLPLDRFGWTGVATLSLAAGATIGFMWLYSSTRSSGCGAEVEAAQQVWNEQTRATLKKKLPARTLQRLDGFADGLLDASKEVCALATASAAPAAGLEARACLAQARRELRSLVQTVQAVDKVDAQQVEASVDAMPPARECVSLAPADAEDAVCGQRLFDTVAAWNKGQWPAVLASAGEAGDCATGKKAFDLASVAHRLRGAVLERVGNTAEARAAYQDAVKAALQSRGELLALAWLALARLEEPARARELLSWTEGLLEHAPSAPETKARVALMRLRLSAGAGSDVRAALVKATAYEGEDPTQQTLAQIAVGLVDPGKREVPVDALAQLPSPPLQAALEVAEALLAGGESPLAGKKLLAVSDQALATSDPETALARCHFASVARALGAKEAALEAHRKIEQGLSPTAAPLTRAVVTAELGRSLLAMGQSAEGKAALEKARAVDPAMGKWVAP